MRALPGQPQHGARSHAHPQAYGVVTVRPKVGATIVDDRMERALDLFSFNTLDISRRTFNDIQGFRNLIEVGSVDAIFDQVRADDIVEMRHINAQLRDAASIAEASELDFRFHMRLVSTLRNRAVCDVYRIMKPVIIRIMERAKQLRDFNVDTFEQHSAVVDAALDARDRSATSSRCSPISSSVSPPSTTTRTSR